jgi:hypothetical protein
VCGYSVEWLRACYSSEWRLFAGSTQTVRGRYYFSPPGTPHYPGPHNYGSRIWISDERDPLPVLGDVGQGTPPFYKGTRPIQVAPARLVGDAACIEQGDRLPLPVITRQLMAGQDSRCFAGVIVCTNSSRATADAYAVNCGTVLDGLEPLSLFSGVETCYRLPGFPCRWESLPHLDAGQQYRISITCGEGNFLTLRWKKGATAHAIGTLADWNSEETATVSVSADPFGTFPATVTVSPIAP